MEGDCKPFLELLKFLCGGDPDEKLTLLQWAATQRQRPGVKVCWAPFVIGPPAIGKNTLAQIFSEMVGRVNARAGLSTTTSDMQRWVWM